jgi:DNA-directed RNA polymerase subunit M/transcription elongation factor TFIIS
MLEFCDECGSLMFPSNFNGRKVFRCGCGVIKPFSKETSHLYKLNVKIEHPKEEELHNITEIIEWKEKYLKSEVTNFECPSCYHDKALIKTQQMRSAHKGMTQYLICLNCNTQIIIES